MAKVVLIEDNKIVRMVQERVLTRAGHQVVSAADGEEALKIIHSDLPDVVLLDMLLPRISGPEVLRVLKADPATAGVPVIVVTGLSKRNEDKLLQEGAAAFLEKEELVNDSGPLLRLVTRVLRDHPVKRAASAMPPPEAALGWPTSEIDATSVQ